MAAQEESPTEPRLTCDLATDEDDREQAPDGPLRVSNLEPIYLEVELVSRGVDVEPLAVAGTGTAQEATVEVQVIDLAEEDGDAVPVDLSRLSASRVEDRHQLKLLLEIPVSEEVWEATLDEYLRRLEEASRREGRLEEFERLTADREALSDGLRGFQTQNRVGRFEIRCTYRSEVQGSWSGEIEATPVRFEVVDEGTVFDQITFPDEAEP